MYCSKCGNQVSDDSLFCSKCGNQVRNGAETKNNVANLSDEFDSQSEYEESGFSVLQFIRGIPLGLVFVAFVLPLFVISCPQMNSVVGEFTAYQSLDLSTAMADLLSQLPISEMDKVQAGLNHFAIAIFSVLVLSALSFGLSFFQRFLASILGIIACLDFVVILVILCEKSNEVIEILPGSGALLSIILFIAAIVMNFIPVRNETNIPVIVKFLLVFFPVGVVFLCAFPQYVGENEFKDARDGHIYKTVKIGTQVWMAENLNYDAAGSLCYDNDKRNCKKYGRLYMWYSAREVCPANWRLPNDDDFDEMIKTVGDELALGRGEDRYGFNRVLSGSRYRSYDDPSVYHFQAKDEISFLWSSSLDSEGLPLFWMFNEQGVGRDMYDESIRYSAHAVRCVKY